MHLTAPIHVLIADDIPELRTLLRTTLQGRGLAPGLGLTVIAGGVETSGQLAKLDQLGCDYAQSYLSARPGTASRVGELLGHDRAGSSGPGAQGAQQQPPAGG